MARKIVEVCNLPHSELLNIGIKGQEFVLREKNNIKQASRIIELISSRDAIGE
ncbi:hypothetical protein D3C73_1514270 [compost metagenome]